MYNESGEHDTNRNVAVGGVDICAGVSPNLQGFSQHYIELERERDKERERESERESEREREKPLM